MSVPIPNDLRQKLADAKAPVDLVDEKGAKVAVALSPQEYERLLYAYAQTLFTDEELDQAAKEGGSFTLAEILADLEKQCGSK